MIWQPKPGQLVKIHYRKSLHGYMQFQGRHGVVLIVGNRRVPKNVLLKLKGGIFIVAPRGNINHA